ncbi:uncharacterized protein LOC135819615 [Sycon ciliatum]|uniref:uncharacterized protein LOC135819615 n=1 Tax=Sycon ciliatum TaxID=27933 RepID=UPI0031F6F43F
MGVVSLIIRLVLNLAVGGGSVMVIYAITSSRVEFGKNVNEGSTCLLWGTKADKENTFNTGPAANCTFTVVYACISILLAILLTIVFIRSIAAATAENHSSRVIAEVIFLIVLLILALVATIIISGGILVFCGNLSDIDEGNPNCKTIPVNGYKWFPTLNIAQIGSWIVSGCWLLHLIFAILDLRAYRKQKSGSVDITAPSDRAQILADPTTFEGSFRDDPPPFEDKDPKPTAKQAV